MSATTITYMLLLKLPNGRDFVTRTPTGRMSNGKLSVDYACEFSLPSNSTIFSSKWIYTADFKFFAFFFLNGKILLTNKSVQEALISSGGKKNYNGKSVATQTPARTKTP